tara:strand:- start:11 stop:295 length:285 start_codon:yes stop_codon:yes gene_type:complete
MSDVNKTINEFYDWMDEVLNGEPLEAEMWKIVYIESLLPYTSISSKEKEQIFSNLSTLTDIEADKLIPYLKENEIKRDPKAQYEQMRKNGMFDD